MFAGEEDNDWKRYPARRSGGNVPKEEVEAARAQLDLERSVRNLKLRLRTCGLVAINFSEENISREAEDIKKLPRG